MALSTAREIHYYMTTSKEELISRLAEDNTAVAISSIFDEIRIFFGEVGEPWKTLASSPGLLRTVWRGIRDVLESGILSPKLKLMIGYEAAKADGCKKCKDGFKSMLSKIGVNKETVNGLEEEIRSVKLRDNAKRILIFSYAAAENPHGTNESTIQAFRRMGISQDELVEAVVVLNAWRGIIEINHMLNIH